MTFPTGDLTIFPMKSGDYRYLAFYKPFGVLSTFTDPQNRSTLKDFIAIEGVYATGRLDYRSEGLLLLTDDGDLIQKLSDPDSGILKTYFVQVEGMADQEAVDQLRQGIALREPEARRGRPQKVEKIFRVAAAELSTDPGLPVSQRPVRAYHPTSWLKIVLAEGRKHHIRRMTAATGFPTLRLVRIAIGPISIGNLQPGEWRWLEASEIHAIKTTRESSIRRLR